LKTQKPTACEKQKAKPEAYEKTHVIGSGASAKVYIAKCQDGSERECALKILDLEVI